jgi:hypothetical protein
MSKESPSALPVPSHSVDVPSVDGGAARAVDDEMARARMRLVFLAAFLFAALAWLGTFLVAINSSETNGIRASWVAIFPTSFGSMGLLMLNAGRRPLAALGIALLSGCVGSLALWLFFVGVWPSL